MCPVARLRAGTMCVLYCVRTVRMRRPHVHAARIDHVRQRDVGDAHKGTESAGQSERRSGGQGWYQGQSQGWGQGWTVGFARAWERLVEESGSRGLGWKQNWNLGPRLGPEAWGPGLGLLGAETEAAGCRGWAGHRA